MARLLASEQREKRQTRLLWLDDVRPPPSNAWIWAKTVAEAEAHLRAAPVEKASLDHDLGDDEPEGRKLVLTMIEDELWPTDEIAIHSANIVGADHMCALIERYGP